jgi:hypothetical protein
VPTVKGILTCSTRIGCQLDLESRTLDQLPCTREIPAAGGEIAVNEDRVDGVEDLALPGAEVQLSAAGGTDFTARVEQPEQTCGLEAFFGR